MAPPIKQVQYTTPSNRDPYVYIRRGRAAPRFYHHLSKASTSRLHRIMQRLIASGTWTASPFHYIAPGNVTGVPRQEHIGWEARPFKR